MPISKMDTAPISFWQLMKDMQIRIPLLQRDYAQGRNDSQATLVRKLFLDALYEALTEETKAPLQLDFVYGQEEGTTLLPLDGQQRLTTLFLLHWYAAAKAGAQLPEVRERLRKFSYQTRRSSRDFCLGLAGYQPNLKGIAGGSALRAHLEDAVWFQPTWKRDPTVEAMLVMLAAIHDKFLGVPDLFVRLTSEPAPVSFHFLNLEHVGLTDDLYLKMNARGKPLTPFEKWKAAFDKLLAQHENVHKRLSRKMDNRWLDFFWRQYQDEPEKLDKAFEEFIEFCTRMLGARQSVGKQKSSASVIDTFDRYRQVYADETNVQYLTKALDRLSAIKDVPLSNYFDQLLTLNQEPGKVQLFGNMRVNLLAELGKADYKPQLLLYALLQYGVRVRPLTIINEDLREYVRVVRNYLEGRRRWVETRFESNLDANNLPAALADLHALLPAATGNVYAHLANTEQPLMSGWWYDSEREKALLLRSRPELKEWIHQLEDLSAFRGQLQGFRQVDEVMGTTGLAASADQLPELARASLAIWSNEKSSRLIIRALLTQEDYSLDPWNSRWYFGSPDDLYLLLTHEQQKLGLLPQFLQRFAETPGDDAPTKLQLMIDRWLESATPQKEGWRYYFVRYPAMTSGHNQVLYYWPENWDFEMRHMSRSSLKGFHINPYVRTVIKLINNPARCNKKGSQDRNREWSPLWLYEVPTTDGRKIAVSLYCEQKGWRLELGDQEQLLPEGELLAAWNLDRIDDSQQYWLPDLPGADRIETAVQFINYLYQEPVQLV